MSNKYHYFYKITNNINGHYYYGVHNTNNLDDGYMGSGIVLHKAFEKYGIENFTKEIIKMFDTMHDAYKYEEKIVNEDLIKNKECYNAALGGRGGHTYEDYVTIKDKEGNVKCLRYDEISDEDIIIYDGYSRSDSNKQDISEGVLKYYESVEGKQRKEDIKKDRRKYWDSPEGLKMRKRISENNKKYYQTEEGQEAIKRHIELRKGKPVSQEHKNRQSKSITKFWNSEDGEKIRNRWKETKSGVNHNSYGKGRRYDVIDVETGEVVLRNACSYDVQVFWPKKVDPSWYYNHDKLYSNRYKFTLSKG